MTERLTRGLLAGLVLVYLLLAGAYSAVTPAATPEQHNPDENAHMLYVRAVAAGHLPVFTDVMHGYENHQPPLYYILAAPVYLAARGHGDVRRRGPSVPSPFCSALCSSSPSLFASAPPSPASRGWRLAR